jgi:predicted PurR-regulated permease PerM
MTRDTGLLPRPRSPQVSPYTVVVIVLTALALLAGLYLLWQLQQVLRWLLIALFLAVALRPPVDWLQRRRVPRGVAILLVYLLLLLVVLALAALVLPPLVTQAQALVDFAVRSIREPQGLAQTLESVAQRYGLGPYLDTLRSQAGALPSRVFGLGSQLVGVTLGVVGGVASTVSILLLTFFLLLDGRRFAEGALKLLPSGGRPRARRLLDQSALAVRGYITGNLTIAAIAGFLTFAVLQLLGMPYSVALALLVGLFALIPLVGATIASVVVITVGFFVSTTTGLILLGYFIIYQQIENNALQPMIQSRSVHLHPMAIFLAALCGAQLLGILGALLAIPAAEVLRIFTVEWLSTRGAAVRPVGASAPRPPA